MQKREWVLPIISVRKWKQKLKWGAAFVVGIAYLANVGSSYEQKVGEIIH